MIALREITLKDQEMIRTWRNLPEVSRYMYTSHVIGPEEHARWFRRILEDPTRSYWIVAHSGEDVGLVNLYDIDEANRRCWWAFYLASEPARARGAGGFVEYRILEHVFEDRGFNKLCCEVLASNHSVIEMHKRFGFRQEGYFRQHVVKDGRPVDVVSMAILRTEWHSGRPKIQKRLGQIEQRLRERGYTSPAQPVEEG